MRKNDDRNILVNVDKVYAHSLPRSLKHCSSADALNDAQALVRFFGHVVDAFATYHTLIEPMAYMGMARVLDLIEDKIAIGSGAYKFPTLSMGDDAPALVHGEMGE